MFVDVDKEPYAHEHIHARRGSMPAQAFGLSQLSVRMPDCDQVTVWLTVHTVRCKALAR